MLIETLQCQDLDAGVEGYAIRIDGDLVMDYQITYEGPEENILDREFVHIQNLPNTFENIFLEGVKAGNANVLEFTHLTTDSIDTYNEWAEP